MPEGKKKKNSKSKASKPTLWDVVVLNDDHNTVEGVIKSLMESIPKMDSKRAYRLTTQIDANGRGVVWTGKHKAADFYREQLAELGLTMDKLRKHKPQEQISYDDNLTLDLLGLLESGIGEIREEFQKHGKF
jgi:ATP-dependent Clp protease adaptor protein ClpS